MTNRAVVELDQLSLRLGAFSMQGLSLTVQDGEYVVMLGSTGAGKTVLLETIVGIHRLDGGSIRLHGEDVTIKLPEERNVGYVPQDYALFPNMTVAENIAYGPWVRQLPSTERQQKVDELLELLGIGALANRLPLHLSGGEKQRVAVGRALAVDPAVLLLDEPLSALDEGRRSELARELRRLQRRMGSTFLHVCHNLDEAAELADRVAILHAGQVVQIGTVEEVVRRPRTVFVAQFTGCANVFPAQPAAVAQSCRLEDGTVIPVDGSIDGPGTLVVRPELLCLDCGDGAEERRSMNGRAKTLEGEVALRRERIDVVLLDIRLSTGMSWAIAVPRNTRNTIPALGERVRFTVHQDATHFIAG